MGRSKKISDSITDIAIVGFCLFAFFWLITTCGGCAATQEGPPIVRTWKDTFFPPTEGGSLVYLAMTGALLVVAGFVHFALTKSFRLLIVALAIAVVPAVVSSIIGVMLWPAAITAGILGAGWLIWMAAQWIMDRRTTKRAKMLEKWSVKGNWTPKERQDAIAMARAYRYVGPQFRTMARWGKNNEHDLTGAKDGAT